MNTQDNQDPSLDGITVLVVVEFDTKEIISPLGPMPCDVTLSVVVVSTDWPAPMNKANPKNITMLITLKIEVNRLADLTNPQIINPKAKTNMKKNIPDSNAISLLGVCFIVLP